MLCDKQRCPCPNFVRPPSPFLSFAPIAQNNKKNKNHGKVCPCWLLIVFVFFPTRSFYPVSVTISCPLERLAMFLTSLPHAQWNNREPGTPIIAIVAP